jgi:hypothetical protein
MDILNWLRIKKENLIRTTLDSPQDLVVLGADVSYQKRGDKYQSYAIPAEEFTKSSRGYKNLLISNITYTYDGMGGGEVITYDILENTLVTTVQLSVDSTGLKVYMPEFNGISVDATKLYINSQSYFSVGTDFVPNLEEGGFTSGSGVMYFTGLALSTVTRTSTDQGQFEIRIYN